MHICEQYVTIILQLVLGCDYIKMCVFIYNRHTHMHTHSMYVSVRACTSVCMYALCTYYVVYIAASN